MAVVRAPPYAVAAEAYPAGQAPEPSADAIRGPMAPQASELIWPSLYTPKTDTVWCAGVKPGASLVSNCSVSTQPAGSDVMAIKIVAEVAELL